MTIEKPISTIRKALKGRAEQKAAENSLDKPEQKHYDESLNFYKRMRDKRPEEIETLILNSAEGKELKDEMGEELYQVFDQIWKEKTKGFLYNLIQKTGEFLENYFDNNNNKDLPRSEFVKKMDEFAETLLNEKAKEIRDDPKIISAFSGKEDVLNKVIDYLISMTIYEARNNYYFT